MKHITVAMCAVGALAGCGKELPPHTVTDFMEDQILLEATMVRCGQNREASRYEAECVSARDAAGRIAAAAEQARRDELEARSEKKRQALRRAREAAEEARRIALQEEQSRQDAAYFGEFEPLPPETGASDAEAPAGASPNAEAPPSSGDEAEEVE